MTSNGMQGSFNAHDKLAEVLNAAQKAHPKRKHVVLPSGDWQQLRQATKGTATRFRAPDGEVVLIYKGFWFHELPVDPTELEEDGYLDLTGDEPIDSLTNYGRREPSPPERAVS